MSAEERPVGPREDGPAGQSQVKKKRVVSLDAARAITVALMIFMDHPTIIASLPAFLVHPEWHGLRLPDFVFPAFIWIAGVSLAYSVSRKKDLDFKAATLVFLRRVAVLFAIGLGLNLIKYGLPLRYLGVLQRIALSLLIAWPFTRSRIRWVLVGAAVLLVLHGVVLLGVGAPGVVPGDLSSMEANISGYIDTLVLGMGHTYRHLGFDPEGVLGTLSAGAQALLGLATGMWLIRFPKGAKQVGRLALMGAALAACGWVTASLLSLPINKELWTPTFVMVTSGVCTVILAAMYYVADLEGHDRYLRWLVPMGRNALLIYVGSSALVVVARHLVIPGTQMRFFPGAGVALAPYLGNVAASLLVSGAEVAMWFVVAAWLDRRKIYVKL